MVVSDPKDLSLRDLRAACRERGLNPGGGKPALEERLAVAIAAGACAPLTAPAPLAGSKRASPVADRHADASRKAARLANERSVVFAAPSPAPEAPLAEAYKTHKADTFLADFLNSPRKDAGDGKGCFSKRVTVSDAKLRDLGVGRDVFALGAESTDARRPDTEAAKAKAREAAGSNIFAENLEDSVAVRKGAEIRRATHSIFAENLEDSVAVRKGAESAVGAAHAATHSIFAEETAEEAAAATRANLGGKAVSETMKRSLFEGNRLFDDDAEAAAVEAARAKAARARRREPNHVARAPRRTRRARRGLDDAEGGGGGGGRRVDAVDGGAAGDAHAGG